MQRDPKKIVIGAIVVILILVIALVAFFLPAQNQPPTSPAEHVVESQTQNQPESDSPTSPRSEQQSESTPSYDPDTVLVQIATDTSPQQATEALSQLACISKPAVTDEDIQQGFLELDLAPGYDVQAALDELANVSIVESAQPNFIYRLADDAEAKQSTTALQSIGSEIESLLDIQSTIINDPRASEQWHLSTIRAYEAWDYVKAQDSSPTVTVAVIDSGCTVAHEDLAANIVGSYDATRYGTSGVNDIGSHGTHVCGIISAVTNNATGVSGISYNAKILPIQVFAREGGQLGASSASIIRAYDYIMRYAAQYNIRVANLSLGAEQNSAYGDDAALAARIEQAYQAGILTVAAAGNVTSSTSAAPYTIFPADYIEHGIGVIALDKSESRASYSNYNTAAKPKVKDLSAPGSSILSTFNTSTRSYTTQSGTSMATPCVSGVAALLFAANPSLTPAQTIDLLHGTAKTLGDDLFNVETGYGLVDAYRAVLRSDQPQATLYRLYNPQSGEHLYTLDVDEYYILGTQKGWNGEGSVGTVPSTSGTPVYRLYNPRTGDHHYTSDQHESSSLVLYHGWKEEGIAWYSDDCESAPMYRLYKSGMTVGGHLYTSDIRECNILANTPGWKYEGVNWYIL